MNNFKFKITNYKNKKLLNKCLFTSKIISLLGLLLFLVNRYFFITYDIFAASIFIIQTGITMAIFSYICSLFFENYLLNN